MALIQCPECGKKVSDKAPSCMACGNPIAYKTGQATTIEQTGKKFKGHMLIGIIILCLGIGWFIVSSNSGSMSIMPGLFTFVGIGWITIAKCLSWWHHN